MDYGVHGYVDDSNCGLHGNPAMSPSKAILAKKGPAAWQLVDITTCRELNTRLGNYPTVANLELRKQKMSKRQS
jgi:hypothetical protein